MITMQNLPDVTLVSIDTTDDLTGTLNGVYTSMSGIKFGDVKIITTKEQIKKNQSCLLYTSPSPRDRQKSRMPSSA